MINYLLVCLSSFAALAPWMLLIHRSAWREGYTKGFKLGVLQGTLLGRYPDQKQRKFEDAQRIVDEADAFVAWEMALSEEQPQK